MDYELVINSELTFVVRDKVSISHWFPHAVIVMRPTFYPYLILEHDRKYLHLIVHSGSPRIVLVDERNHPLDITVIDCYWFGSFRITRQIDGTITVKDDINNSNFEITTDYILSYRLGVHEYWYYYHIIIRLRNHRLIAIADHKAIVAEHFDETWRF
jgi:hypothetical protein